MAGWFLDDEGETFERSGEPGIFLFSEIIGQ
jgi:hypothetical protein